jgi:thiol-disulfide isomerase/thioredoxin
MKQVLVFFLLSIAIYNATKAQGIEFFHGTFAEALEKAKIEDKIVFMDAFTEWCGPCKNMARTVFTNDKVGKFYNSNFICLKMDMEKGEGPGLSQKLGVTAYPSLFYLNAKGETVHKSVGALNADQFISLGKTALGKTATNKEAEKSFAEGKRDPETVYGYVRSLNKAGKPTLKIVNEYFSKNPDLSLPTNLKLIFEGATQADTKLFDLLIKNKKAIIDLYSEQQFKSKIEQACEKTVQNAVIFKSEDLHKEAKTKMKANYPEHAEEFAISADMQYYQATGDAKKYCKTCEILAKQEPKSDAKKLHNLAQKIQEAFPDNKSALEDAERYAKKAAENGGLASYYYTYAQILAKNGKKKEAQTNAQKSLKLAKEGEPQALPAIEQLIEQLKG